MVGAGDAGGGRLSEEAHGGADPRPGARERLPAGAVAPPAAEQAQQRGGGAYPGRMITGGHVIIYSRDAEADRAFFRDVLEYPHVDAGGGWLIFKLPPTEIAVHPTDGPEAQELYLMCDDINATVKNLSTKGVEFTQAVTDARWGRLTRFRLPGGGEVGMYEPRHERATEL
jgi:predicted enzyme related to lactoylglutathione lyase